MIIEEQIEDFIITRLQTLRDETDTAVFKKVDGLEGMPSEITEDVIGEFVRVNPACLVGIFEHTPTKDIDAEGTVQKVEHEIHVVVCTTNKFRKRTQHSQSKKCLRYVKNSLRGCVATFGGDRTNIRYKGQTVILALDSIVIYEQRYSCHVIEKNDL